MSSAPLHKLGALQVRGGMHLRRGHLPATHTTCRAWHAVPLRISGVVSRTSHTHDLPPLLRLTYLKCHPACIFSRIVVEHISRFGAPPLGPSRRAEHASQAPARPLPWSSEVAVDLLDRMLKSPPNTMTLFIGTMSTHSSSMRNVISGDTTLVQQRLSETFGTSCPSGRLADVWHAEVKRSNDTRGYRIAIGMRWAGCVSLKSPTRPSARRR